MKKIIIIISLIFIFFTEAAYAASVKIGVIDTGVKEKGGILDSEKYSAAKIMFLATTIPMTRSDMEREWQALLWGLLTEKSFRRAAKA